MLKELQSLMQEIVLITTQIETNYPELYKYLGETPVEICDTEQKTICSDDLRHYLETLKSQLKHHIETHKQKKK